MGATAVVVCLLIVPTVAHVALTFPPARKYDLDFLDNSRTKAPCGMPKGEFCYATVTYVVAAQTAVLYREHKD